jgi:hypothetical protein
MMQWEFVVALMVGVGAILFPVALVWYLNLGGIYAALQKARGGSAVEGQRRERGHRGDSPRADRLHLAGGRGRRRDTRWNGP